MHEQSIKLNHFGLRIKKLRENARLTQAQFAEVIGVSTNSVGSYEREGKKTFSYPSLETLIRIARFFSVSLDWLCDTDPLTQKNLNFELGTCAEFAAKFRDLYALAEFTVTKVEDSGQQKTNIVFDDAKTPISITTFMHGWEQMRILHASGTINNEFLEQWINSEIEKLKKIGLENSSQSRAS